MLPISTKSSSNTAVAAAGLVLKVVGILSFSLSDNTGQTAHAFSSEPLGRIGKATASGLASTTGTGCVDQRKQYRHHKQQHHNQQCRSSLLSLNMQQQQQPGRKEEFQNQLSLSAYASELVEYEYDYNYDYTNYVYDPSSIGSTASSIGTSQTILPESSSSPSSSLLESFVLPVFMASLMVTGNTVGAGMLVMPEVAAGPGIALTFCVMIGVWVMCLTSGLTIAQVAIREHEASGTQVPSSFKEFAEATLPSASNMVSGASVFINTLVVAFDVFKAGQIGSTLLPESSSVDGMTLSYIYSTLLVALVSTQSLTNLSRVASVLVVGLFATFAGLLLPGLANVPDLASVLSLPPTLPVEDIGDGILHTTPVVISVLVFQNIVPTITRLLDYDRLKVAISLVFGSSVPLLMYMAWTVTVLGGGIGNGNGNSDGALGAALMVCFSLITVAGSSLGGSMSLSEEFEILLDGVFGGDDLKSNLNDANAIETTTSNSNNKDKDGTFSLPSVAMPIGIALGIAQIFSSDITETLKIAGAFGSPILYGLIPVSMALMQQRQQEQQNEQRANNEIPEAATTTKQTTSSSTIVPGGIFGLGALAMGSAALIGTEVVQTCGTM